MEHRIEDAILTYSSETGGIDWSCSAEDFVTMDAERPERLWAKLIPGHSSASDAADRFTVVNHALRVLLLSFGPGASNGAFTAIIHADKPGKSPSWKGVATVGGWTSGHRTRDPPGRLVPGRP